MGAEMFSTGSHSPPREGRRAYLARQPSDLADRRQKIREKNKMAMQRFRNKQRVSTVSATANLTITPLNRTCYRKTTTLSSSSSSSSSLHETLLTDSAAFWTSAVCHGHSRHASSHLTTAACRKRLNSLRVEHSSWRGLLAI